MRLQIGIFFTLLVQLCLAQSSQFIALQEDIAKSLLLEEITLPENTILIESHRVTSPFAEHVTFQQMTNGLPVRFAEAKIHLRQNGNHTIQNNLIYDDFPEPRDFGNMYLKQEGEIMLVQCEKYGDNEVFLNEHNELISEINHIKYYKKDTTLWTKVFNINPINSSGEAYGERFRDRNDSTSEALETEMVWREIPVKYSNDSFFLESRFMYFGEIRGPEDTMWFETNDTVVYTRDQQNFERMNAYYHIQSMGEFIEYNGHLDMLDTLLVDVHAGFNDDSGYRPSRHSIEFGKGGVDDAEDGEVVIHEYIHSLSELASPDNTVGSQRVAMEEGNADYLAKSYSRSINDNFPDKVFSWDGHNQFWPGFLTGQRLFYPDNLEGNKNNDRQLWSSVLMCAHDRIGRAAMDSLVLEHFYYQKANATMPEMAQEILDINENDFNGRYTKELRACFTGRGFVTPGVSVEPISHDDGIKVLNQSGFVSGEGNLTITSTQVATFFVYNVNRQLILESSGQELQLHPENLSKGMYVVYIRTGANQSTLKVLR